MRFAELEEGAAVFVDANVFIYHFTGASRDCTGLLTRCEANELRGSTSTLTLAEVSHRLMMIEAVERKLVSPGNVAHKLGRRPDIVRRLSTYEANVQAIPAMGIEIVSLSEATIMQATRHQRRYGLLTNDSLIVGTMLQQGVNLLATADQRFAAVDEIEIVGPGDLGSGS